MQMARANKDSDPASGWSKRTDNLIPGINNDPVGKIYWVTFYPLNTSTVSFVDKYKMNVIWSEQQESISQSDANFELSQLP